MNKKNLKNEIILIDDYYEILLKRNLDYAYFEQNKDDFIETYNWLYDDKSKFTMICYLKGHIEINSWPMLPVWSENDIQTQYFPDDIIDLSNNEIIIDCGAFTGDTLDAIGKKIERFNKYYALEPDEECYKTLKKNANRLQRKGKIIIFPIGASDKKEDLYFMPSSCGCGQVIYNDADPYDTRIIKLDCIDNIVSGKEIVTFIKMDIEGSELKALKGAENTIKKCKPKMSICVYHKKEDLITIPQFIKNLVPEYRFYLRGHFPTASEVVLYCVCEED